MEMIFLERHIYFEASATRGLLERYHNKVLQEFSWRGTLRVLQGGVELSRVDFSWRGTLKKDSATRESSRRGATIRCYEGFFLERHTNVF